MNMTEELKGKTALVTGASRGIGRATALALARQGANLVVHFNNAVASARELVTAIRAGEGTPRQSGLTFRLMLEPPTLASDVAALSKRTLDILVANAGITRAGSLADHTEADFDRLFATNVKSVFYLITELLPTLTPSASVIVLSSIGAHSDTCDPGQANVPTLPVYASTKGALDTMVKHLASMLGPRGIRVNAVAPGIIATDMSSFTKSDFGRGSRLAFRP